ncbi:MAG: hypothetical protein M1834_009474 [Cirrosporium novae-zelandiae]|nr:MAG: hypothetical protein M1834_009474 [Cirrosporium novae-zelandiae]
MSSSSAFLQFWWNDITRDTFLHTVPKDDLFNLRLVCHDFSIRTAPALFGHTNIAFKSGTFTRPSRMAALERIGHYIRTLTFHMAHSAETFLPPILNPATLEEQSFIYTPHIHISRHSGGSNMSVPKYGDWETTNLLVQQWPTLFHAATNVPSFIRALNAMPSLKHLEISCPGQELSHRYRRSAVDYALISLRIAVEQAPLVSLDTLTLLAIHPSGIFYLRPTMAFGSGPGSTRKWSQIRKLAIHMDSFPSHNGQAADHLKLLHSYLQAFSSSVTRFFFRWRGSKGPSPLSLSSEPGLSPSPSSKRCKACPKKSNVPLRPLKFAKLRYMELENVIMDASQVSVFVMHHRHTLREFNFEDAFLRSGTWEDALAPLTRITGSEKWKEKQEEIMDVPIMLSPVGIERGQVDKVLWEEERRKARLRDVQVRGGLLKAKSKARELFWGSPEHMKKFLRTSVFSFR